MRARSFTTSPNLPMASIAKNTEVAEGVNCFPVAAWVNTTPTRLLVDGGNTSGVAPPRMSSSAIGAWSFSLRQASRSGGSWQTTLCVE